MQREKIKPIVDVPLLLQMETVSGQEASSVYNGVEYRYNVVHENRPSVIYLPAEGRDAIVRAQPVPGDYVELLKQKRGAHIVFQAQVLGDAYEQGYAEDTPQRHAHWENEPQPTMPPRPTRLNGVANGVTRNGGVSQGGVRLMAPAPARAALPPPPGPQRAQQQHQAAGQAQPPRPDDLSVSPIAQQVAGCLRVALDAWEEIRKYARERYGVEIQYTTEDIRATGTSVFIQRSSGGGR